MSFRWKILIPLAFVFLFVTSGYLLSDDLYFHTLIGKNQIKTPEQAFTFVVNNTTPASNRMNLTILQTPYNMLVRQKSLFCDQSAIVMATLVHKLGYETRLVDLKGDDGISHHTLLDVKEKGVWKTYDPFQNLEGITYEQSAMHVGPGQYSQRVQPIYHSYPRFYNSVIQSNFYLKHLALWLRRQPG